MLRENDIIKINSEEEFAKNAQYCNDNGLYLDHIEDNEYLVKKSEYIPTATESAKLRIRQLKKELRDTDYQAIKHFEGCLTDYEYEPIKIQRQAWRDEINDLEKLI